MAHLQSSWVKTMQYEVHLPSTSNQINTVGRKQNWFDLMQNTNNTLPSTSDLCRLTPASSVYWLVIVATFHGLRPYVC